MEKIIAEYKAPAIAVAVGLAIALVTGMVGPGKNTPAFLVPAAK